MTHTELISKINDKTVLVGILGLGYVGLPLAVTFARKGIKVLGFIVDTDPMESYGTYYIYFDDLRAVTDLFAAENRDADDMADTW